MTQINFRAYYKYDGPTPNNPIASELSDEDVLHNLMMLESDFIHFLDDKSKIKITKEDYQKKQVWIQIQANCSTKELKSVIEEVLGKAQLYGEIL
jgi:hypothetical protein